MKNFVLAFLIAGYASSSYACDVCGCGLASDSWGLAQVSKRHFLAVRSQYRNYISSHPDEFLESAIAQNAKDYFFNVNLVARIVLRQRLQVSVIVPYRNNHREEGTTTRKKSGLGDASLHVHWLAIQPGNRSWKHSLQLSAGLEAPTGEFEFSHDIPVSLQCGSGSWDMPLGLNYSLKKNNTGLNLEAMARINGPSEGVFQAGNTATISSRAYYQHQLPLSSQYYWIGMAADLFQESTENRVYDIPLAYSRGSLYYALIGIEKVGSRFRAGIEGGLPIFSDFAEGLVQMKAQINAHIICFINPRK